ncbi:Arc family DNA-binding protein [uncultured Ruegeria sp.]|uniref:Arc family DNA-binding protein n=1 Tax=uncultured Ruegeria sp. TaxID=259304 RepID=UPI002606ECC2|nr:Arc family DNA-binding protein [uncultured Ruegeria sp.]
MANEENRKLTDQYLLRLPDGLRSRIKEHANRTGRSMNSEILALLIHNYGMGPSRQFSWRSLFTIMKSKPDDRVWAVASHLIEWKKDPDLHGGESYIDDLTIGLEAVHDIEEHFGRQMTLEESAAFLAAAFPEHKTDIERALLDIRKWDEPGSDSKLYSKMNSRIRREPIKPSSILSGQKNSENDSNSRPGHLTTGKRLVDLEPDPEEEMDQLPENDGPRMG